MEAGLHNMLQNFNTNIWMHYIACWCQFDLCQITSEQQWQSHCLLLNCPIHISQSGSSDQHQPYVNLQCCQPITDILTDLCSIDYHMVTPKMSTASISNWISNIQFPEINYRVTSLLNKKCNTHEVINAWNAKHWRKLCASWQTQWRYSSYYGLK